MIWRFTICLMANTRKCILPNVFVLILFILSAHRRIALLLRPLCWLGCRYRLVELYDLGGNLV